VIENQSSARRSQVSRVRRDEEHRTLSGRWPLARIASPMACASFSAPRSSGRSKSRMPGAGQAARAWRIKYSRLIGAPFAVVPPFPALRQKLFRSGKIC